ncbi:MAG TPA: phosphatidylglycerophosphatase A [Lacunisphaera sp.]|jgi:phosphatidylglycerophosphatase A|nr:phosphatidylglycerophosphatase A [Lacunisphaera sp.]HQY05948.1 phosphatidylglycerophosphatase A [Lacunisphaera sp.]
MDLPEPRWPRILPTRLVVAVATLGPLGTRLPAPGTWGSLAGLLYFLLLFRHSRWEVVFTWSVLLCYLAVAFCGDAARRLGKKDPGEVILDEFAVIPLVFLGWRAGYVAGLPEWAALLAGFALFRFYDILKPLGISRLQRWPGGWGIVADDFAAALAACGTLHFGAWLWVLLR